MLGPGLDRRRAERDAQLLEHGLLDLLAEYEQRILAEQTSAVRGGSLTPDRALQYAAQLTVCRDLLAQCERARRNLQPQEPSHGLTPTRA
jgi:hypothetical protein